MKFPVALTGATGFIGTSLRRVLVQAGYPVRALTRRPMPAEPGVTWISGDLAHAPALLELVTGTGAAIHCAGTVRGASRAEFDRINVGGTAAVVAAVRAQPNPPRLLFISSLAARHPSMSWYAASKAAAERCVMDNGTGLQWTILRPTAVYGPGDREMRPFFEWLLRGVLPTPQPDGARFSLLHVDDLADAVRCWVDTPAVTNAVYELSDGVAGGYAAVALAAEATTGLGRKVRVMRLPPWLLGLAARTNLGLAVLLQRAPMLTPGKVRELTHPDWRADPAPFMQDTGWRPRIRFMDALAARRLFFT